MNQPLPTYSGRSRVSGHRRQGTTLIEVLAGLLLLGTLLVSVTVARGRFIQQWTAADRKLTAIRWADSQIAQWLAGPVTAVPVGGEGTLDAPAKCSWRTRRVADTSAESLGAAVIRLEIIDRENGNAALASVDFLLHVAPAAGSESR